MGADLTVQGVINIFQGLACYAFNIAFSVLIIAIIISGIRYMAAGGSSEKAGKAKKNFFNVLIGGLVILGVSVIITSVAAAVGSSFNAIPLVCN